jgi:hypothetical protein
MSDISLHIKHETGRIWFLKPLTIPSFKLGKWIGKRAVRLVTPSLDGLLLRMAGYYELSLFFSPAHARKELESIGNPLKKFQLIADKNSQFVELVTNPGKELESYCAKYGDISLLIGKILHRLKIVSYFDSDAETIMALPDDLRSEITSLNIHRINEYARSNPGEAEEVFEEMEPWLNAEFSQVLDSDD